MEFINVMRFILLILLGQIKNLFIINWMKNN